MKRITLIQGHPDPQGEHFGHALAQAYAEAAAAAGHELRRIEVAKLDFALLRSQAEWQTPADAPAIVQAQQDMAWAEHLVIFHPLWLGEMPALLKGFFEQAARGGFGLDPKGGAYHRPLRGRSAHIVVTMGMPALLYRWYFRAHGLKNLKRGILGFVGVAPIRSTLIGMIESGPAWRRNRWIERMRRLGAAAR